MNPIKLLLEWRINNFIRDFDINMEKFSFMSSRKERKENWIILKQKLFSRGYIMNDTYPTINCYMIIKNIIWKNIIKYENVKDNHYANALWNKTQHSLLCNTGSFLSITRAILLDSHITKSGDNINILQEIIIKFLILVDNIITQYLIPDLSHITKLYMLDSILTI